MRETARKLMRTSKKSVGEPNDIDFGPHGHDLSLALELVPAPLSVFEGLLGPVALSFDPRELFAQVAVVAAALLGFGCPLVSAMFDFGKLTHGLCSLTSPHGDRRWGGGEVEREMIGEDRAIRSAVHLVSKREPRPLQGHEQGETMTYNRMEAKPRAGEQCRFCGDAKAPLVKTPCCHQWICCDTAFFSFRGGGTVPSGA